MRPSQLEYLDYAKTISIVCREKFTVMEALPFVPTTASVPICFRSLAPHQQHRKFRPRRLPSLAQAFLFLMPRENHMTPVHFLRSLDISATRKLQSSFLCFTKLPCVSYYNFGPHMCIRVIASQLLCQV